MSKTRILVTGGAGFIGSHYVRTLLGPLGPDDVTVTVLDAFTYAANPANLDPVADSPATGSSSATSATASTSTG